jgi:hypothetical protein
MCVSFLGLPDGLKSFIYIILGGMIIYLAYMFYQEQKSRVVAQDKDQSISDNVVSG